MADKQRLTVAVLLGSHCQPSMSTNKLKWKTGVGQEDSLSQREGAADIIP